jgi:hypothetical protein
VSRGLPVVWGATAAEASAPYGCDSVLPGPCETWFRAVTVHAPAAVVFRWLCQLKVAPYSYDLADNLGRRSPRTLTPGAERLAVGQPVMTIFELAGYRTGHELTLCLRTPAAIRVFGRLALSYQVAERGPDRCRLAVKLVIAAGPGRLPALRRRALAWGDLVMMSKQLRTIRALAEATPPG